MKMSKCLESLCLVSALLCPSTLHFQRNHSTVLTDASVDTQFPSSGEFSKPVEKEHTINKEPLLPKVKLIYLVI